MSNKIKRIGVITVCVLATVLVGGAAINHYNQYQNKVARDNQAKAEQVATEEAQKRAEAEAKEARVFEQYTQTRMACEKGQGFYARLTAFQRGNETAPNCGPAVIN